MDPVKLMLAQSVPEFVNGLLSAYQTYKHYEYETRKLKVETLRIKQQTEVALKKIASDTAVKLAALENQRYAIEANHQKWMLGQESSRLEQQMLHQAQMYILQQMSQPGSNTQSLQFAYQMNSKLISERNHQSNQSLMQLANQSLAIVDSGLKKLV